MASQSLFWAYLTVIIFVLGLTLFPIVYILIEKFMMVITIICVVGLLIAAFGNPAVYPYWPKFLSAMLTPKFTLPTNWDPKDASLFITAICFAGMGGFWNCMYSYWLRDKGVGMAAKVGRVTSPITGKPESIPGEGYIPRDTEENRKRYKQWLKYLYVDNSIGVFTNMFTVTLTTFLGFALLHPKGLIPTGWKLVAVQGEFFGALWGRIGYLLMWLIGFAFIVDCWLGACDGLARMHADYIYSTFKRARVKSFRWWYYLWVGILTLATFITMPLAQPGFLLILVGVLNFIAFVIYLPVVIYMNYYKIPKTVAGWTRPHILWLVVGIGVTAIYTWLTIWYLGVTFGFL